MQKTNKKIILLAGKGLSTNIIFHQLKKKFEVRQVILEEKESTKLFLKRRVKKLGYFQVFGQILFQLLVIPILRTSATSENQALIEAGQFKSDEIEDNIKVVVPSVNDISVIKLLASIEPDVVVVNGTRIISKKILNTITCPIINMHAGITPRYRGVHGAYWALVNGDIKNCGVTVHLVDAGVDTGDVLYQTLINKTAQDNFTTYPIKQLIAGIPFLIKSIEDALSGNLKPYKPAGPSQQWYHPTIWQYLNCRIKKGIK